MPLVYPNPLPSQKGESLLYLRSEVVIPPPRAIAVGR